MLISELIAALTVLQKERGNLELLTTDGWAVTGVESATVTANQSIEWDMAEGEMFATLTDAR